MNRIRNYHTKFTYKTNGTIRKSHQQRDAHIQARIRLAKQAALNFLLGEMIIKLEKRQIATAQSHEYIMAHLYTMEATKQQQSSSNSHHIRTYHSSNNIRHI